MSDPIKVSGPNNTRWPEYRCHKVVAAVKILAIEKEIDPSRLGTLEVIYWVKVDADGVGPLMVNQKWMIRHTPEVGGYIVAYVDGYISFSPAKAFEEGYTRIDQ